MLTTEQRDALVAIRDAHLADAQTHTAAAIAIAVEQWHASIAWGELSVEETLAKNLEMPAYPHEATLRESLENATDEVKFTTYLHNGLDRDARDLAVVLLSAYPTPVLGSRYTELGIVAAFANPADGDACLRKLEAAATQDTLLARMLNWLKPGAPGLDFGFQSLRAAVSGLAAAAVITEHEKTVLLSLGTAVASPDVSDIKSLRL